MATHAAAAQRPFKIPESVLVVIHSADGEVLLLERTDMPGHWQGVTGARARVDEPLFETAIREVAEETGIVIGSVTVPRTWLVDWQMRNVFDIYPHYLHRYAPGVTRNVEHVFGLRVPRDVAITLAPREHTHWRWLPALAAADACFSSSNAEAILQLPRRLQAGTRAADDA